MKRMDHQPWGLHWFRRDLRVPSNQALGENWKRNQGRTLGFFCFDRKFLSRPDFSHKRFAFFLKTLKALKDDLHAQGGDLLVVDSAPLEAFSQLLNYLYLNQFTLPSLISWSRDYEPYARERDQKIQNLFEEKGLETYHARDHLLFEPHELLKSDKPHSFYQIYSPYARQWFMKLISQEGQERLKSHHKILDYFNQKVKDPDRFRIRWVDINQGKNFPWADSLTEFEATNRNQVGIPIPQAGFYTALGELMKFKSQIEGYKKQRDFPAVMGTSRISIFLKNGTLTVPQVISVLQLSPLNFKDSSGPTQFLKELVWREFYYSILFHRPDVEKKSFLPHYENLAWENNENWFDRWKEGTTGFPIVDAGMRELATTGWMHNRVRMIVASFLTKDLLIDWRWGENHFMKELLDGDLAPNNGGWQWAASTGCDPQPYFRVFNPWLQSMKFDPEGHYIKTFVHELKDASPKLLHDPDADRSVFHYPQPLVHHSVQRQKALHLFKNGLGLQK